MSLADEVRTLRRRVAQRLTELEPLVREYEQLREIADELGLEPGDYEESAADAPVVADALVIADGPAVADRPAARRGRARPQRAGSKGRRGRAQSTTGEGVPGLLEAVRANPGATVAEIASIMEVAPTALYRPVRDLTAAGEVVKRGRTLFPAGDG